jgi:hypothetical protein
MRVQGLELLALLSALAFVAVGAAVGVKLLWLARRTRALPELLIGAALLLLSAVAWPLLLVVTAASVPEPALRGAMSVATFTMGVGWSAVFLFTWQVFRPGERWARAFALAGICVELAAAGMGMRRALVLDDVAALRALSTAGLVMLVGTQALYVWTALEAFRYRALLRRRIPLGLADPLVADRFGKWGWSGVFGLGSITPAVVAQLSGGNLSSPASQLVVGLCGLASSAVLYLAFLPPAAYVRWVRQSAPVPVTGGGF